ncbi:MAG: hypothetical protein LBQ79_02610 [Deltaproteobacteria bacterium]|nr:hypothetical protein [Deltaproteobacteria bacterium]
MKSRSLLTGVPVAALLLSLALIASGCAGLNRGTEPDCCLAGLSLPISETGTYKGWLASGETFIIVIQPDGSDMMESFLRGTVEKPPTIPRGARIAYSYDAVPWQDSDAGTGKRFYRKSLTEFQQVP